MTARRSRHTLRRRSVAPRARPAHMPREESTMRNVRLEAALSYCARGLSVTPLHPGSADPILLVPPRLCGGDTVAVMRLWREYPLANVGLITGQSSGCFAVAVPHIKSA